MLHTRTAFGVICCVAGKTRLDIIASSHAARFQSMGWNGSVLRFKRKAEDTMAVTGTGAGLEGIIAAESSICYIDGQAGILSYQGFNIHTLAEHATFEEVVFLLWTGRLPAQSELDDLKAALVRYRDLPSEVVEFLRSVPKGGPMDVLR